MGDDICKLRATKNVIQHCDEGECVFWRALDHLGFDETNEGCAIQHFELLGNDALVEWLLSVKERVDGRPGRATAREELAGPDRVERDLGDLPENFI